MAYHMLVANDKTPSEPLVDKYLGTASIIDIYWESIGEKLSLPILSSITEKADSEEGFVLEGDGLVAFKDEIIQLEKYWKTTEVDIGVPEGFFDDIQEIKIGIDKAIENQFKLMIG